MIRSLRWCLRWWTVLPLALAVLWAIATVQTQRAVDAQLASIAAKGEAMTMADAALDIPPGADNAALTYQTAFDFLPDSDGEDHGHALADLTFAREYLVPRQTAIRLLQDAAEERYCSFPTDWSRPHYVLSLPHLDRLRQAARLLILQANVLAAEGRADESLRAIHSAYRIADHTQSDPFLITPRIAHDIIDIAHTGLEEALAQVDPSPAVCREVLHDLGLIDFDTPFRRALLGERARGIGFFDDIRSGDTSLGYLLRMFCYGPPSFSSALSALYPSVGRPFMNADEITFLRIWEKAIEAAATSWPQSSERVAAAATILEDAPATAILSHATFPAFAVTRTDWGRHRAAAILAVDRAALCIGAFKSRTGRYPESLEQVEAAGWDVPDDPLTGKPLLYRREGDSFAIWSVGPNMQDDGGVGYDDQTMDDMTGPYDIIFICDRAHIARQNAERKQSWGKAGQARRSGR